jgi:hypothetical protein
MGQSQDLGRGARVDSARPLAGSPIMVDPHLKGGVAISGGIQTLQS